MKRLPLKVFLCSFGKPAKGWPSLAFTDYAERIQKRISLKVTPLRESSAGTKNSRLSEEAIRFQKTLPKNAFTVLLSEEGKQMDSRSFAHFLEERSLSGNPLYFLIGSADGIDPSLRKEASLLLSLGKMTLPHEFARIVLAEQIYRGLAILEGHPYHRD